MMGADTWGGGHDETVGTLLWEKETALPTLRATFREAHN